MKTIPLILVTLSLIACKPLTPEIKQKASSTGELAIEKLTNLVKDSVIDSAISQLDKDNKVNYLDSLAEAFWTQPIASPADVKELVALWTPEKSHWRQLGNLLANTLSDSMSAADIAQALSNTAARNRNNSL